LELEGFGWIVWPLNLHLLILLQLVNEVLHVLSGILLLGCLELRVILAKELLQDLWSDPLLVEVIFDKFACDCVPRLYRLGVVARIEPNC